MVLAQKYPKANFIPKGAYQLHVHVGYSTGTHNFFHVKVHVSQSSLMYATQKVYEMNFHATPNWTNRKGQLVLSLLVIAFI